MTVEELSESNQMRNDNAGRFRYKPQDVYVLTHDIELFGVSRFCTLPAGTIIVPRHLPEKPKGFDSIGDIGFITPGKFAALKEKIDISLASEASGLNLNVKQDGSGHDHGGPFENFGL